MSDPCGEQGVNNGAAFGYFPHALDFVAGDIRVRTLPGLDEKRRLVEESGRVFENWYYSPRAARKTGFGLGGIEELPFPNRLFDLPLTHQLDHAGSTDPEHIGFLLWCLGFLHGMRFSADRRGFLDATPLRPGTLVDFHAGGKHLHAAMVAAESFWTSYGNVPGMTRSIGAVIHALFLSTRHNLLLGYEQFIYAYTALDGCWWVFRHTPTGQRVLAAGPSSRPPPHSRRIKLMCAGFRMPEPTWASSAVNGSAIDLRNETLHEALFLGAPLGFRTHAESPDFRYLISGMRDLVCRLVVALLGIPTPYVRSSTLSNQRQAFVVDGA
jgi:hypothetical protein